MFVREDVTELNDIVKRPQISPRTCTRQQRLNLCPLSLKIPLSMFTDSESLFKVIIKSSTTTEKKLIIDVKAAPGAYDRAEISDIGWICSKDNPADGLTKAKRCDLLEHVLYTGRCDVQAKQWIVRNVFSKDGNDNETIEDKTVIFFV